MSLYCAAYEAKRLRELAGWTEDVSDLRPHTLGFSVPGYEVPEIVTAETGGAGAESGGDDAPPAA